MREELPPKGWDLRIEARIDSAVDSDAGLDDDADVLLACFDCWTVSALLDTVLWREDSPVCVGLDDPGSLTVAGGENVACCDCCCVVAVDRGDVMPLLAFASPSCTVSTSPLLRPKVDKVAVSPADVSSGFGGCPVLT